MNNLKNVVYQRLEAIMGAEKITRKELGALSREALIYVPESNDIELVNRLIGILTPMNRLAAIMYFTHFLPWEVEKDNDDKFVRFGKKTKSDRKVVRKMDTIKEWLADEGNTIWTWADDNIEVKQKDLAAPIKTAIKNALHGHEKSNTPPISMQEIMGAIFLGGVTIDDMLQGVETRQEQMAEAAQDAVEAEAEKVAA